MVTKEYFRGNKVSKGLEVTKFELYQIAGKLNYISISEADKNLVDDNGVVGVIMGDIDNILADVAGEAINKMVVNPDCWFVNKSFMDKNYKDLDNPETRFTFGEAVELLKLGYKVARIGWNGKNMFLFLVPGSTFKVSRPPLLGIYPEGTEVSYQPHIDMKTAQGTVVPWLASQSDVLAEDWVIVKS